MRVPSVVFWVLLVLLCPAARTDAAVLRVGADQQFHTITSALEAAAPGDTVLVAPGFYAEALRPRADVSLRSVAGPDSTILDGGGVRRILQSDSMSVSVDGFTFQNGNGDYRGGGAALLSHGRLEMTHCVLRENFSTRGQIHQTYGGAVCVVGSGSQGVFADCFFYKNELRGGFAEGGAVGFRRWNLPEPGAESGLPAAISGPVPERPEVPIGSTSPAGTNAVSGSLMRFTHCSFIGNTAGGALAICATGSGLICEIRNCLFADAGRPWEDFLTIVADPLIEECNIFWGPGSPPEFPFPEKRTVETIEKMAGGRSEEDALWADPRFCPGTVTMHASSPAVDLPGCGRVGNLQIGCEEPSILYARPIVLRPARDQVVRIYAYGLDGTDDVSLNGPGGEIVPGALDSGDGPWLTFRFDLTAAPPGDWALRVRAADGRVAERTGLTVSPVQPLGFLAGWVAAPGVHVTTLFGHDLQQGVGYSLRHSTQGTVVPVTVLRNNGDDSLRVEIDLRGAPEGPYDLLCEIPWGGSHTIPYALYCGTPATIRVPEDFPTIQMALHAAAPCTEVAVAAGTWNESLTLTKPVRLRGEGAGATILHSVPRPVHVMPECGALTEISGFSIRGGNPAEGSGAGIWSEAPCLIRNNRIEENTLHHADRGAGVFCLDGCRVIGNTFDHNRIDDILTTLDPWSIDPATGGVGGGLFCLSCLVAGNVFQSNSAPECGAAVATGIFRDNRIEDNWAEHGLQVGALRGEVFRNVFDNHCGAFEYLLIRGPARVWRNTFSDTRYDLCEEPGCIQLSGSIDFYRNTLAEMYIDAALATSFRDPGPAHFRMWDNILCASAGANTLRVGTWATGCTFAGESPRTLIPADSISIGCNLGDHASITFLDENGQSQCEPCFLAGRASFCGVPGYDGWGETGDWDLHLNTDSEALPENRLGDCPDTLGALGIACGASPVLITGARFSTEEGGIRLAWTCSSDLAPRGIELWRESDGASTLLTAPPLAPCVHCEYLDTSAPEGALVTYRAVVIHPDGSRESVLLGTIEANWRTPARLDLQGPVPNPVRSSAWIELAVPAGGRDLRLELMDASGRKVATLVQERVPPGTRRIWWDGRGEDGRALAGGLYFLRLRGGEREITKKVLVVR